MSTGNGTTPAIATAREVGEELGRRAPARESAGEPVAADRDALLATDLAWLPVPAAAGGAGASLPEVVEVITAVSAGDAAVGLVLASHHAAVLGVLALGDEDGADALLSGAVEGARLLAPAVGAPPLRAEVRADGRAAFAGAAPPRHGTGAADAFAAVGVDARGRAHAAILAAGADGVTVEEARPRIGLRRAPSGQVVLRDALGGPEGIASADAEAPSPALVARALAALLDAAVIVGAARGSVQGAAELTRLRPRPRPVPGVTAATADPLAHVVIGGALAPIDGADALVGVAARELGAVIARDGADPAGEAALVRALSALDTAIAVGLRQGEEVYEVAGTSGSGNVHGFDRLWRDVRTLSLLWPRAERRRPIGRQYLEGAFATALPLPGGLR